MKNKTIIIDAAHPEEKRVAVLEKGILQDFNREALSINHIKGNIYYAKITRVEASLQACFVDYGNQKHGFLPFAEIHPDYFQISEEERKKLLEDSKEAQENENDIEKYEKEHHHQSKNDTNSASESIITGSYSIEDETERYHGNVSKIYKRFNIQDVIKPNQLILVQAIKEEKIGRAHV